jgi:hypothetical protein
VDLRELEYDVDWIIWLRIWTCGSLFGYGIEFPGTIKGREFHA